MATMVHVPRVLIFLELQGVTIEGLKTYVPKSLPQTCRMRAPHLDLRHALHRSQPILKQRVLIHKISSGDLLARNTGDSPGPSPLGRR